MQYTETQQSSIKDVFNIFNSHDLNYAILRGYEEFPKSNPGGDLDIYIHHSNFSKSKELLSSNGFQTYGNSDHKLIRLLKLGVKNPVGSIHTLLTEPDRVYRVYNEENQNKSLRNYYNEFKLERDGLVVHCQNHLGYKSTHNNKKLAVHPDIEEDLLANRIKRDFFYKPAPVDELAHLVGRGVYDYGGEFPEYYKQKCDHLWNEIKNTKEEQRLDRILSLQFFKLGNLVKNHINRGEYDNIRVELKRSIDY